MDIKLNCFPKGKTKVVTMSYDDGTIHDRRLVDIFNQYGIKGTFHLNSGFFGRPNYIDAKEVAALYKGHEVSVHTLTHPFLTRVPKERIFHEIMKDRENLEALVGYPVRGMSYPFGDWNADVEDLILKLGMEYARVVEKGPDSFKIPEKFILWHPSCHHKENLMEQAEDFIKNRHKTILYVWGHSYEFENDNNWNMMEDFCRFISKFEEIWFATNIEIVDYVQAMRNLKFTLAMDKVKNPSYIPVWITVNGMNMEIPAGQLVTLEG